MTKFIEISQESSKKFHLEHSHKGWSLYYVVGIVANVLLWGTTLLVLKFTSASYSSKFYLTLPSSSSSTNVTLPNIGTASYQNSSPFTASTQDPRENYKLLGTSEAVISAAAKELNLSKEEFGKVQIKTPTNTSIMGFELKGATPQEAQTKAWALYKALQARLDKLRVQEAIQRDSSFQYGLSSAQTKLEIAQKRLSDYKARSGLNSNEQIQSFSDNIEQLRRQRAEILAQQQQAQARVTQMARNLNLSSQQATDAFVLKSDQVFQQYLKDYSDASGNISVLSSKFLPDHPTLLAEKAKQEAAQRALLARGQALLGRTASLASLRQLNLSNDSNSAQEKLYQDLVTVQSEQRGNQAQAAELDRQIARLEARLKVMAQQETTLDALKRDLQIAEAVFSSTLTRLDIGRSNASGSYPLLQLLAEPSLPEAPSSPPPQLVLLGATLGSLFLTMGLVLLWRRQQRQRSWMSELEQ
jgi:uncharacterized protein involved in exopolysaccharide biosynthesis